MRICPDFEQMTPKERQDYVGGLIHCCMVSPELFKEGQKIIEAGKSSGLFEGIKFDHTPPITEQK